MRRTRSRSAGQGCFQAGAHTLVEMITVVLVLGILAAVAVPRINLAAVGGVRGDAAVRLIATDLRRTRANAILCAAENPKGFALVMTGAAPYRGYKIVDLHNSAVVATCKVPDGVRCSGGQRFKFGPLGNLVSGSDTTLRIVTDARTYALEIITPTGAVTWTRHED
ncbi:MAG: Tfp pilus assembly protein FimT/FimU [Solirubrobacterales bacterium]